MNYFDHNDSNGRDARIRVAINRAERARRESLAAEYAADPWCVTLFMSKYDLRARRAEGTCAAYGCERDAGDTARVMRANDALREASYNERGLSIYSDAY